MQKFEKNMGGTDRIVRSIIGVVLVVAAIYLPMSPLWTAVVFALAGIQFLTAALAFCPLYALMGRSSNKKEEIR